MPVRHKQAISYTILLSHCYDIMLLIQLTSWNSVYLC